MGYSVKFDFGTGWIDYTELVYRNLTFEENLHNNFKPSRHICKILIKPDSDTALKNFWNFDNIFCLVEENGDAVFLGEVKDQIKNTVKQRIDKFEVEVEDISNRLDEEVELAQLYTGMKVIDNEDKSNSILHQIMYFAGYSDAVLNFATIDKTITYFALEKDRPFREQINGLLFEFGFLLLCKPEGVFENYNYTENDVVTTVSIDNDNIAEFEINKRRKQYEEIKVIWSEKEVIEDVIIFTDNRGSSDQNKANISIEGLQSYPPDSEERATYARYEYEGKRNVIAISAELLLEKEAGIEVELFENNYRNARISLRNTTTTAKNITRLDIQGTIFTDGIYRIARTGKTNADRVLEITTKYLSNAEDVLSLMSYFRSFYDNNNINYRFKCNTDLSIGTYVTLREEKTNIEVKARIVRKVYETIEPEAVYHAERVEDFFPVGIPDNYGFKARDNGDSKLLRAATGGLLLRKIRFEVKEEQDYYAVPSPVTMNDVFNRPIYSETIITESKETNFEDGMGGFVEGIAKFRVEERPNGKKYVALRVVDEETGDPIGYASLRMRDIELMEGAIRVQEKIEAEEDIIRFVKIDTEELIGANAKFYQVSGETVIDEDRNADINSLKINKGITSKATPESEIIAKSGSWDAFTLPKGFWHCGVFITSSSSGQSVGLEVKDNNDDWIRVAFATYADERQIATTVYSTGDNVRLSRLLGTAPSIEVRLIKIFDVD